MADIADRTQDFGANSWLVEEMYERYRDNPAAVSEQWQEFFSDYKPLGTPRADVTAEIVRPGASVATQSGKQSGAKPATKSITPTQPAPAPGHCRGYNFHRIKWKYQLQFLFHNALRSRI